MKSGFNKNEIVLLQNTVFATLAVSLIWIMASLIGLDCNLYLMLIVANVWVALLCSNKMFVNMTLADALTMHMLACVYIVFIVYHSNIEHKALVVTLLTLFDVLLHMALVRLWNLTSSWSTK